MPYVRTRLGRWFYEERGNPARSGDLAVVLMHGLLFDGGMWRYQIEPLSALGRVIILDGPGHGKSESPPRFTLEEHADALAIDAFAELNVSKAILVGLSWGGMVAMRAAIQHPMRIEAMALIDSSAEAVPLGEALRNRALAAIAKRGGIPPWMVEREIAPVMFGEPMLRAHPEFLANFGRTVNGFPREGLARAALAVVVHRKDVTAKLRGVAAPTLVMCGRQDKATPLGRSETLAAKIRDARLEIIEDSGHTSALEQPEAVNRVLVPFVKEQLAKR